MLILFHNYLKFLSDFQNSDRQQSDCGFSHQIVEVNEGSIRIMIMTIEMESVFPIGESIKERKGGKMGQCKVRVNGIYPRHPPEKLTCKAI